MPGTALVALAFPLESADVLFRWRIIRSRAAVHIIYTGHRQRKRQAENHERTGNGGEAENAAGCESSKIFATGRGFAIV